MVNRTKIPTLLELFGEDTAESRNYGAGSRIFRQGDRVRHLFAVVRGQVQLERQTLEGRSVSMYRAEVGECFAEAALYSDTYHCNAVATKPSRVLLFPADQVRQAIRSNSATAEAFISRLAQQVRDLRSRLELRNVLSARDRILHYLLLVAGDSNEVTLETPLKAIASELGLAHETLYRELARLEEDGLVKRRGRSIRIKSLELE